MSPQVYFEPIGEEIECDEDEAVLDAAFRQGYSLAYGCREGQCSACKAYVLSGDVALRTYSTFALSDSEEAQGYTLLCQAMPDTDLTIELLHYDPDGYRLETPIRDWRGVVSGLEQLTHDIRRLVIEVIGDSAFDFKPGQFVDLWVPGSDQRRSFSIANLPGERSIELVIKRYEDGLFSGLLDGGVSVGDELSFTGPYGSFYLRGGEAPALLVAGGSGMAPVLSVLRALAQERSSRPVRFFYGARGPRDLFWLDLVAELGSGLADFAFVPVLSAVDEDEGWGGERGFVHEAVSSFLRGEPGFADAQAYICGPPPMIDATIEMLVDLHAVDEGRIFYDKFTPAAGGVDAAA